MGNKSSARPVKKAAPNYEFKGFVDYVLTGDEKAFLKEQGVDFERLDNALEGACDKGYTFKFSWDSYNKCYMCIVAVSDPESANAGWFLTGRGSQPIKALRQALYICEQIGWQFAEYMEGKPRTRDFIDD